MRRLGRGGKPLWSFCSLGDTGNGFLSAIAIIQALYHRERTGEGQLCETSIVNAQLLNTSYALARPDGSGFERPRVDAEQLGFSATNRLYETADGWLCIVAATEEHGIVFVVRGEPASPQTTASLERRRRAKDAHLRTAWREVT